MEGQNNKGNSNARKREHNLLKPNDSVTSTDSCAALVTRSHGFSQCPRQFRLSQWPLYPGIHVASQRGGKKMEALQYYNYILHVLKCISHINLKVIGYRKGVWLGGYLQEHHIAGRLCIGYPFLTQKRGLRLGKTITTQRKRLACASSVGCMIKHRKHSNQ